MDSKDKEKKKNLIALYLNALVGGGAERVFVDLANTFAQRGLKVDLVLNVKRGPYLEKVSPEIRIVDLKNPRPLIGLPKLVKYFRKERPAVLLSALHYNNEIALLARSLARVPTRVVVSERSMLSIRAKHLTGRQRWSAFSAKVFYPWADGIIAISRGVAKDLVDVLGLPSSKIRVIYNLVKIPEAQEKAKEPMEHDWFANNEPPVILGVGRLETEKAFSTLIRAFAQARKVRPCRLMILGEGSKRKEYDTLIKDLGLENDISMPGFVKNPYAYMARSAVFVLSSIYEGFGNVIIEAMAVGTPVICTNCPSGPVEILDNGKYGELVPVGDVEAIAKALLKVLSGDIKPVDPSWIQQFSLDNISQQYLDVLGIS